MDSTNRSTKIGRRRQRKRDGKPCNKILSDVLLFFSQGDFLALSPVYRQWVVSNGLGSLVVD